MLSSRSRLAMFVPLGLGVLVAAASVGCDSPDQAPVRAPVAVADAGTDGATPGAWTAYSTGLSSTLAAVWGSSASDVYAVGYFPGAHRSFDRSGSGRSGGDLVGPNFRREDVLTGGEW